jgi:hypothetical protein
MGPLTNPSGLSVIICPKSYNLEPHLGDADADSVFGAVS